MKSQPKKPPAAPPVYRPQPTPLVLQKKERPGAKPSVITSQQKKPIAPPVYRPEPKRVAQPKAIAHKPDGAVVQRAESFFGTWMLGALAYAALNYRRSGNGGGGGQQTPPPQPVQNLTPSVTHTPVTPTNVTPTNVTPTNVTPTPPVRTQVPTLSLVSSSSVNVGPVSPRLLPPSTTSLVSSSSLSVGPVSPRLVPPPPTLSSSSLPLSSFIVSSSSSLSGQAVPPLNVSLAQVDRYHFQLMEAGAFIGRLNSSSAEVHLDNLSASELEEVWEITEQLSDFTFGWVTLFNSLNYHGSLHSAKDDRGEIARDLISRAEAIGLAAIHGRATYLYKLAQKPRKQETVATPWRYMSLAMAEAAREKNRHPHGPHSNMGKTIAALVNTETLQCWVAISGATGRSSLSSRTKAIISCAKAVEEWPVDACAEVNALEQAIASGLDPKPGVTHLFSYCYTWSYKKNKWTGRSACHNCKQWLAKYK